MCSFHLFMCSFHSICALFIWSCALFMGSFYVLFLCAFLCALFMCSFYVLFSCAFIMHSFYALFLACQDCRTFIIANAFQWYGQPTVAVIAPNIIRYHLTSLWLVSICQRWFAPFTLYTLLLNLPFLIDWIPASLTRACYLWIGNAEWLFPSLSKVPSG